MTAVLQADRRNGDLTKVWLDADTGNEIDDVYAIVRLLAEPEIEIVGISSSHFNNPDLVAYPLWNQYPTQGIRTVEISQELNERVLTLANRLSIPHPLGADRQIGRAWGGNDPRPSPASTELIAAVHALRPFETVDVLCLGTFTNLATAVLLEPGILPHVRCFALCGQFDASRDVWNKNEFNIKNDLNAFDYLLNHPQMDLTIMPIDTAFPFRFERDSVNENVNIDVPIQAFLKERWEETNPEDNVRILWDLALIEAYLVPEFATIRKVPTPPENLKRMIRVYTDINPTAMAADFWGAVRTLAP